MLGWLRGPRDKILQEDECLRGCFGNSTLRPAAAPKSPHSHWLTQKLARYLTVLGKSVLTSFGKERLYARGHLRA